jgi:acyl-CoA hydrolase
MEKRIVEPKAVSTARLVKSEDLNHHGTLFAGRTSEWFVESGFISAASLVPADTIVCLKVHGLYFTRPVYPGEIVTFQAKIVYAGRTSLVAHIEVYKHGEMKPVMNGFITFVHVDSNTKPCAHNIEIHPITDEDKELYEQAANLKR